MPVARRRIALPRVLGPLVLAASFALIASCGGPRPRHPPRGAPIAGPGVQVRS